MFNESKRQFLFKCEDCEMVLAIDLEEDEDLKNVQENKIALDCPCGGACKILRN